MNKTTNTNFLYKVFITLVKEGKVLGEGILCEDFATLDAAKHAGERNMLYPECFFTIREYDEECGCIIGGGPADTGKEVYSSLAMKEKLKTFYITFGSNEQFPYPNSYIVVVATSEKEASEKFREKYPDATPGTYNFSFIYGKDEWVKGPKEYFKSEPAEILGIPQKAIDYINAFCQEEFESDADFSDPEAVGVFYTTVDYESERYQDLEIELQNNVNLIDMSIERYLQGILFEKKTFDTEEAFLWALENLNESDLVYVSEEQFVRYYRTKAKDYLEDTKQYEDDFHVSFNLEYMIKNALIEEGYEATEHNINEVLECVCMNPFNYGTDESLKKLLYGFLLREIKENISYLDEPEIQNAKGKDTTLQTVDLTYGDIIADFNARGFCYEGTHSLVNFASVYYPDYMESFYKILMKIQSKEDTEKFWNIVLKAKEKNNDLAH